MKYKVGDKVRVRKDLKVSDRYENYLFTNDMERYKGKQAIIESDYGKSYKLDIDRNTFNWSDEMLEPINGNGQKEEKVRSKTDNSQKKI